MEIPDPGGTPVLDSVDIISYVGRGCYGSVFKGRDKESNQIVALKKVNKFGQVGLPLSYYRETTCLQNIDHENVIKLIKILSEVENGQRNMYLMMEYCDFDLHALVHGGRKSGLHYSEARSYMKQILTGLSEMHRNGFVHRDLKPSNIFVTRDNVIKIGDLGLSRRLPSANPKMTPTVATMAYRAPELLLGSTSYDTSVDMWSIGCVFYEMITGKVLFKPSPSDMFQLDSIFKLCGSPSEETCPSLFNLPKSSAFELFNTIYESNLSSLLDQTLPEDFLPLKDLFMQLLQLEPSKRINAFDALEHPFFSLNYGDCSSFSLPSLTKAEKHALDICRAPQAVRMKVQRPILRPERLLPPISVC